MGLATLTLSGWDWGWPVLGLLLLAWIGIAWGYRRAGGGGWRWVGAGLKGVAVALLAWCLLEPLWSQPRARPGANLFAILVDNTQSLQVRDRGETRSRGESLQTVLVAGEDGWQAVLDSDFEVRRFLFDTRLRPVRQFDDLSFDGQATALGQALRGVAGRFAGRPLAGILLFTDGNATDAVDGLPGLEALPPVYPVVFGRAGSVRDVAVTRTQVSQSAFEDAPVTVQAEVRATGFTGETLAVWLVDAAGQRIEEQTHRVRRNDETWTARFQFRPATPGWSFHRVRAGLRADLAGGQPETGTSEATWLNNERVVPVQREGGPYRVLYVAGRPNWEYKFLYRALLADEQTRLVALMRIALREPRFDFRGRAGETGNPLFRGFGDQSREAVERYDQPIVVRLNTRDELELSGGFPRTPEELFEYDALILDDLEAAFFPADQALLIQRFVSDRGGGLLMLGGAESFREGGYYRHPIGELLPVYLDRAPELTSPPRMQWEMTPEGWLLPWARLRDNEAEERLRRAVMPPFEVVNPVQDIKPGASLIAVVRGGEGERWPALATQRFGRGRTAALTVGDVWRWGMRDPEARADMDRFWRQLVRWLVADVPRPVELAIEPNPDAGEAVDLQVRVRNRSYEPLDEAVVTLEVEPVPVGSSVELPAPVRLRAEASVREAGLFEATFVPRSAGGYRLSATVRNEAGAEVGRADIGWSANPAADEFRSLEPNLPLLESLARRTGGSLVGPADLAGLVRELPRRDAPHMETEVHPAWHTPWLFALALGLLIAEWGLRRRKGLP